MAVLCFDKLMDLLLLEKTELMLMLEEMLELMVMLLLGKVAMFCLL